MTNKPREVPCQPRGLCWSDKGRASQVLGLPFFSGVADEDVEDIRTVFRGT
jgi:hypothetical protein